MLRDFVFVFILLRGEGVYVWGRIGGSGEVNVYIQIFAVSLVHRLRGGETGRRESGFAAASIIRWIKFNPKLASAESNPLS